MLTAAADVSAGMVWHQQRLILLTSPHVAALSPRRQTINVYSKKLWAHTARKIRKPVSFALQNIPVILQCIMSMYLLVLYIYIYIYMYIYMYIYICIYIYIPVVLSQILQCIMCMYLLVHIHAVRNTTINRWYHYVIWITVQHTTCFGLINGPSSVCW